MFILLQLFGNEVMVMCFFVLFKEWEDERLLWDPNDYNGLQILRIPCEKIWLPDIVLYNRSVIIRLIGHGYLWYCAL